MVQYSALRCVSGIWQNNEKLLISNGLRSVVTYLLTVALWVLFHCGRHTFAVMMLDLGTDIYTVSKLLGHRELSTVSKIPDILTEQMEQMEQTEQTE